jgi:hypothetical protein
MGSNKIGKAMLEIILNVLGNLAALAAILFAIGMFLHRCFG